MSLRRAAVRALGPTFALALALSAGGASAQDGASPGGVTLDDLLPGAGEIIDLPGGETAGEGDAAAPAAGEGDGEAAGGEAAPPAADGAPPDLVQGPDGDTDDVAAGGVAEVAPATAPSLEAQVLDEAAYDAWARLVDRARMQVSGEEGSTFGLQRLRAELVDWRERFLAADGLNTGRLATAQARLDALGPAPEDPETETEAVSDLRAALRAEIAQLAMPRLLAADARAQASGLIDEIDTILRARERARLSTRAASPFAPATWQAAGTLVLEAAGQVAEEIRRSLRSVRGDRLPAALGLGAVGLALLCGSGLVGRRMVSRLQRSPRRSVPALLFVVSLGFILLPFLGVLALVQAAELVLLQAPILSALMDAVPLAALSFFVASWIGGHLFGTVPPPPVPLDFAPPSRRKARGLIVRLGLGSAALTLLGGLLRGLGEVEGASGETILRLGLNLAIAVTLYRLGRLFVRSGTGSGEDVEDDVSEASFRHALLANLGRAAVAVAIAATIAGLLGYAAAAGAVIRAAISTLEIFAILVVLQRLIFTLYAMIVKGDRGVEEALMPVLAATILFLASLPLLALVWGARPEDLADLWTRFQAGVTFGETQVSPSDFVFFVVVFVAGYLLTRMLQALMRSTILPRTRLDTGARTALVAGLGYIGIFLAVIIAIVSAGIDLSSLAIVAGALSVGIGFGLQNIVSNFVSGIILLIERPISEGDWIEVGGQMGYVRDISVRSTRIETFDRTDVIVPNADLVSGQVTNWTRGNNVGRAIVPVGVAYGSDTDEVTRILREVAESNPMVILSPPPAILFRGFGASSLDFEIRAILRDVNFVLSVQSEMNHAIARRFAEAGIEIPFPQQDLWLRNPEALRGGPGGAPSPA